MLRRFRHNRATFGLAALYALALVLLGFAHRPAVAADARMEIAAYALPDGSVPPVCGTPGDAGSGKSPASAHCEACALSAAPGLAGAPEIFVFVPTVRTIALTTHDRGQYEPPARHAPSSRGPPLA